MKYFLHIGNIFYFFVKLLFSWQLLAWNTLLDLLIFHQMALRIVVFQTLSLWIVYS